jgi:hypothetical protein
MSAVMAKRRTLEVTISLLALATTIAGCAAIEDIVEEADSDRSVPGTTVFAEPYEAVLLDGSTITISQGDDALNRFTEGVPSAIHSLNLLAQEGDCHQIEDDAESWAAQSSGTEEGRMASAFANHGESVYAYIECGKAARKVEAVEVQGEIRYDTCNEAIDADGGNYLFGIDPEYRWYEDRDGDGVVCEAR